MSTGLRARRATGLTGAEREERSARTESVARWSREGGERTRLTEAQMLHLIFNGATRTSNQAGNNYIRGEGESFLSSQIYFSLDF